MGIAEPAVEDIAEVAAVDIVAEPAEVGIAVVAVAVLRGTCVKNSQTHFSLPDHRTRSLGANRCLLWHALFCRLELF